VAGLFNQIGKIGRVQNLNWPKHRVEPSRQLMKIQLLRNENNDLRAEKVHQQLKIFMKFQPKLNDIMYENLLSDERKFINKQNGIKARKKYHNYYNWNKYKRRHQIAD
jgi:hypothetical protein